MAVFALSYSMLYTLCFFSLFHDPRDSISQADFDSILRMEDDSTPG